MQEMRCLGQAGTEFGGAEEPWEHPTPLLLCSLAAWVDVDGREQPGRCPLLTPGCSRAENAALCHNMTSPVSINSTKKV